MDARLSAIGYILEPSKYKPALGYSGLKVVISGKPTERFFDCKSMQIPTFDGRAFHQTQVTRHELEVEETFLACLGELQLESHRGDQLRAFSFGGRLHTVIEKGDLYCDYLTRAPIFKMQEESGTLGGGLLADEIIDLLAEQEVRLPDAKDEMYARLAKYDPYQIFLACVVSMKKRIDSIPSNLRWERFRDVSTSLNRIIQVVRNTDGWDGHSPGLEDLLSEGGA